MSSTACTSASKSLPRQPTSPVLLIYQKGIQQQNPDVAAAIGVILVLGVMVISLVNKYVLERD